MNADALRRELLGLLPRLRRYAYALTGVRHDADDLLQATLERLLVTRSARAGFARRCRWRSRARWSKPSMGRTR